MRPKLGIRLKSLRKMINECLIINFVSALISFGLNLPYWYNIINLLAQIMNLILEPSPSYFILTSIFMTRLCVPFFYIAIHFADLIFLSNM
jgi:hypothetical protein